MRCVCEYCHKHKYQKIIYKCTAESSARIRYYTKSSSACFVCSVVSIIFFWFFFSIVVLCKFVLSYQLDCSFALSPLPPPPTHCLSIQHLSLLECWKLRLGLENGKEAIDSILATTETTILNKYRTKYTLSSVFQFTFLRAFQIIADKVVYLFKLKLELITKRTQQRMRYRCNGTKHIWNSSDPIMTSEPKYTLEYSGI